MTRVAWAEIGKVRALRVTFEGHLDGAGARKALDEIEALLAPVAEPVIMVWDARGMSGYDVDAREAWQAAMKAWRGRIACVDLVATRLVVRTGGRVVGIFSKLPIRVHASWAELEAKYQ